MSAPRRSSSRPQAPSPARRADRADRSWLGPVAVRRAAPPTFSRRMQQRARRSCGRISIQIQPVSTFSIDVDTASYSFVRASLNAQRPAAARRGAHRGDGQLLPLRRMRRRRARASRSAPRSRSSRAPGPRAASSSASASRAMRSAREPAARQPRVPDRHVGLDERAEPAAAGRSSRSRCCSTQLQPSDRVAIVTYAGNAGTALEPTAASREGQDPRRRSSGSAPAAAPRAPRASARPMRSPSGTSIRTASTA